MNWLKSLWKAVVATGARADPSWVEIEHNLTPRAQQVLALARKEADRFNHNFVGTEHLLLGLIGLGQGVATNVLQKNGLDLDKVRPEIEKQIGTTPAQKVIGNIPYTPRVKRVLALAAAEAKALNHAYVGTEHILLGLLREGEGVAARVLTSFEVDIEQTRIQILKELDPNFSADPDAAEASFAKTGSDTAQKTVSPKLQRGSVDTSKRYDVYCSERSQEIVVYRNALFKGVKTLFKASPYDTYAEFLEIEQADGQTVFISKLSVIGFCGPGVTPSPERVSGTKP